MRGVWGTVVGVDVMPDACVLTSTQTYTLPRFTDVTDRKTYPTKHRKLGATLPFLYGPFILYNAPG